MTETSHRDATDTIETPITLGPPPIEVPAFKEPIAPAITKRRPPQHDLVLFGTVLALLCIGVVMTYSASAVYAAHKFGSATYFLRRELFFTALGLVAMTWAIRTDFAVYRRWSYALVVGTLAMLTAVLIVGVRINGARRWFHLGGLSFQPTALAKFALVVYLAYSLAKKAEKIKSFTIGFVPHMLVCGLMMLLLLVQPDLGAAIILGLGTIVLLFVAGAKLSYIVIAILGAAPMLYQMIIRTPWRLLRILAYINPWQYRHGTGYQITESLISVGSGGMTGMGLGDGKQKLLFLPEAHTDYIFAIIGEELGLIGIAIVITLFGILLWRGVRTALRARDAFGCYLAFGITAMFSFQALVNMGVVLGALPTKGLPLPFVSYGGSTLVVDLFMFGVLLNISRGAPESSITVSHRPWMPRLFVRKRRSNRKLPGRGRRVDIDGGAQA